MLIEILSVCKKNETDYLSRHEGELKEALGEKGYTLRGVKKTLLQSSAIKSALASVAKSYRKPDVAMQSLLRMEADSALLHRLHMHQLTPRLLMAFIHVFADALSMLPLPLASQMPNSLMNTGSPLSTAATNLLRRSSLCVSA